MSFMSVRNSERRRDAKTSRSWRVAPKGMTLLELLIAMSIMLMVVGTLAGIARAVQLGFEYNQGHGNATQHARVTIERITGKVREATATKSFPGFVVLDEQIDTWRFPDTLVVWFTDGPPLNDDGTPRLKPRLNELVIYCPHPKSPGTLVEISTDSIDLLQEDDVACASQIEAIKASDSSRVTTLTDLVRISEIDESNDPQIRAAVRFASVLRPSESDWDDWENDDIAWEKLPWAFGPQTGLRHARLRIEIQLMTGEAPAAEATDRRQAIPFFGSAAIYYPMRKDRR